MAGVLDAYKRVISPDGRAVEGRSFEDLANLAKQGLVPFNDVMALKQMADETRARAQAMQAQQTLQPQPTVVDGYINELRAQVAGAANQDARMGGIANLPAPNIGTQAMASGGIVAFAKGGDAEIEKILQKDPISRTPQEIEKLRAAGYEVSARKLEPEGGVSRLNAFLESPFLRRAFGEPEVPTEQLASRPGVGAITERLARSLGAQQAPAAAPVTPAAPAPALQPAGGISAASLAGSPFDIAGGLMPQPSPFGGAQGMREFSAPAMSQAELRELLRTDPYVAGGGGGAGIASLARNAYRPATDALAAQLKDIQGRKYDTAADYEKAGIGAASKAQEERIQKDLAKMPEDKRFAALMALSEAGFRMAGEASKPGATLLGSAAAGGTEGLKSYVAGRKELREREERLGDKQSALAEKREELRRAALDQDAALRRGDQKSAQEIAIKIAELQSDANKLEIQMRDSASNRAAMLARDQDPNRRMTSAYYQAKLSGNEPRAQQILAAMAEIRGVDVQLLKAQLDAESRIKSAEIRAQQSNPFSALGGLGAIPPGYSVIGPKAGTP